MKQFILTLCLSVYGGYAFSQLTYVPDDALEAYFEFLFPGASKGSADDYVFTSGLQQPGNAFVWEPSYESIFGNLFDLTGIQDCKNLDAIMFIDVSPNVIDLSTLNNGLPFSFDVDNCDNLTSINLSNVHNTNNFHQLSANNCNQLTQINLPKANITDFVVFGCPMITSINFPVGSKIVGPANVAAGNNISLTFFDISNAIINGGCDLILDDNQNLNCVNLKGGYCNMITPYFSNNPFVSCVQVDNTSYSSIAWQNLSGENWLEQWYYNFNNPGNTNNPYTYSTNCNCAALIVETENNSEYSIYPNPTTSIISIKSNAELIGKEFAIYDQLGKKVKLGIITSDETEIDLTYLNQGMYLFKVVDEMQESFKIIKQ